MKRLINTFLSFFKSKKIKSEKENPILKIEIDENLKIPKKFYYTLVEYLQPTIGNNFTIKRKVVFEELLNSSNYSVIKINGTTVYGFFLNTVDAKGFFTTHHYTESSLKDETFLSYQSIVNLQYPLLLKEYTRDEEYEKCEMLKTKFEKFIS